MTEAIRYQIMSPYFTDSIEVPGDYESITAFEGLLSPAYNSDNILLHYFDSSIHQ